MSKNFDDLFSRLKEIPTKKVAVAVATGFSDCFVSVLAEALSEVDLLLKTTIQITIATINITAIPIITGFFFNISLIFSAFTFFVVSFCLFT